MPDLPDIDPTIEDLVPGYLAPSRRHVELMREALSSSDLDGRRRIGHNMKGSGTSFGFPRSSELGASVESAAVSQDRSIPEPAQAPAISPND